MRLFNRNVPCGCESRKAIMFTEGDVTPLQFGVGVVVALGVLGAAWKYGHRTVHVS